MPSQESLVVLDSTYYIPYLKWNQVAYYFVNLILIEFEIIRLSIPKYVYFTLLYGLYNFCLTNAMS